MAGKKTRYRRYRGSAPTRPDRTDDPLQELRDLRRADAAGSADDPRSARRLNRTQPSPGSPGPVAGRLGDRQALAPRRALRSGLPPGRRMLRWFVRLALVWTALSALIFLLSAQLHQSEGASGDPSALGGGQTPPIGKSTILVIGSDTRPSTSKEPGASTRGYGLADSIMLLRVGGGTTSKLSIARDTLVPINGHGISKINAAYAYGGPELLVTTVEDYTGIDVNHVMQISFTSFPALIDAMGGITYRGSCVISKINGGYKNGGITLRIRTGEKVHLNGKQALALARTRKNACNRRENDLSRARRQQRVLASMKRRALSPIGFVRLPLIAWEAPKTLNSDMAGPRLIATMTGLALSTGGKTRVLGTESGIVPDELKRREVNRFLGDS